MNDSYLITIDGGTTNTRAVLWKNEEILAKSAREVGARNTAMADGSGSLKEAVRDSIRELLEGAGLAFSDLDGIAASGMITSNVGLVEIPHLTAPADAAALAAGMRDVLLEEVCPLPISFIPGVKNAVSPVTAENFDRMDMMRGEETETFAILNELQLRHPAVILLPGSHTKFVAVDASGSITGCLTTINGELLSAITHNTILAASVNRRFATMEDYDAQTVKRGAAAAAAVGLGRACFSARILNTFVTKDPGTIANFLLGAVLQGDAEALLNSRALCASPETEIIIAGKDPLRRALYDILQDGGFFKKIRMFETEKNLPLGAAGAKYLYGLRKGKK